MTRRPPRHGLAVTPWFAWPTVPLRPGVYERNLPLAPFSYWNGAYWGCSSQTVERAERFQALKSVTQDGLWRGLAEEPKR